MMHLWLNLSVLLCLLLTAIAPYHHNHVHRALYHHGSNGRLQGRAVPNTICSTTTPVTCNSAHNTYRTLTGECNNVGNWYWGAANIEYLRLLPSKYDDGSDTPRIKSKAQLDDPSSTTAEPLKNPRVISVAMRDNFPGQTAIKETFVSNMVPGFGQFLDHDTDFTPKSEGSDVDDCCTDGTESSTIDGNCHPIDVSGDNFYQNNENENGDIQKCLQFVRSFKSTCTSSTREQVNGITAYLDLSGVYGLEATSNGQIRYGQGGLLKVWEEEDEDENKCDDSPSDCPKVAFLPLQQIDGEDEFYTPEVRSNENGYLVTLHHIWHRVHNDLAIRLFAKYPLLSDEVLFQEARRIAIALYQNIVYSEFLPVLFGSNHTTTPYCISLDSCTHVYDSTVNPSIRNHFATASYRFGHTMVHNDVFGGNGRVQDLAENLRDNQFELSQKQSDDWFPSAFMRGITIRASQVVDTFLVDALANKLPDGTEPTEDEDMGSDLLAINIKRGREHGLPGWNDFRAECTGKSKYTDWTDITTDVMDSASKARLQVAYDDVDDVELYTGGLAEKRLPNPPNGGGVLGETFACLLQHQFYTLKVGDRFFFLNNDTTTATTLLTKAFTEVQISAIKDVTFASIMCELALNDSDMLPKLQPKVFEKIASPSNLAISCSSIPSNYEDLIEDSSFNF